MYNKYLHGNYYLLFHNTFNKSGSKLVKRLLRKLRKLNNIDQVHWINLKNFFNNCHLFELY